MYSSRRSGLPRSTCRSGSRRWEQVATASVRRQRRRWASPATDVGAVVGPKEVSAVRGPPSQCGGRAHLLCPDRRRLLNALPEWSTAVESATLARAGGRTMSCQARPIMRGAARVLGHFFQAASCGTGRRNFDRAALLVVLHPVREGLDGLLALRQLLQLALERARREACHQGQPREAAVRARARRRVACGGRQARTRFRRQNTFRDKDEDKRLSYLIRKHGMARLHTLRCAMRSTSTSCHKLKLSRGGQQCGRKIGSAKQVSSVACLAQKLHVLSRCIQ